MRCTRAPVAGDYRRYEGHAASSRSMCSVSPSGNAPSRRRQAEGPQADTAGKVVAAPADRRAANRARVDARRRAQMILASARQRAGQIVAEADQHARRRVEQAEREATNIVASNVTRICSPAPAETAPAAATPSAGAAATAGGGGTVAVWYSAIRRRTRTCCRRPAEAADPAPGGPPRPGGARSCLVGCQDERPPAKAVAVIATRGPFRSVPVGLPMCPVRPGRGSILTLAEALADPRSVEDLVLSLPEFRDPRIGHVLDKLKAGEREVADLYASHDGMSWDLAAAAARQPPAFGERVREVETAGQRVRQPTGRRLHIPTTTRPRTRPAFG